MRRKWWDLPGCRALVGARAGRMFWTCDCGSASRTSWAPTDDGERAVERAAAAHVRNRRKRMLASILPGIGDLA